MNDIRHLAEALQRGNLVLFIGADLPETVTGLPSRADLAARLAQRLDLSGPSLPLPEVAGRYEASAGRFSVVQWLKDQLDPTGKTPQPFHQRLVELAAKHSARAFITTAYDSLLAIAFEQAGVARDGVLRNSDLRFADPDRPRLIWLYGKVEQVDSLVITEQDHWNLLRDRDREEVIDEVKRALRQNTVLFLGYDLSDPDFRFLFNEVADSRFARLAYAVWPGFPEGQARLWRERGIVLLDAEPLTVLDSLLGTATPSPEISPERTEEPTTAPRPGDSSIDSDNPPIAAIRDLLEAAFTAETLKRFCQDRPTFRPLVRRFSTSDGLSDMVERVIVFCGEYLLWDELLAEVKAANPKQYARFQERFGHSVPRPPTAGRPPGRAEPAAGHPDLVSQPRDEPESGTSIGGGAQTITWLHLSDLHFRRENAYDERIVLRALLQDIQDRGQEDGLHPDFVVVSGDIAFAGKPEEYDLARQFFDDLLAATGLGKDRLFPVPGNHDVDRRRISRGAQGIAASLTDRKSVNEVLANADDRRLMLARFQGYQTFVNDYLGDYLSFTDDAPDDVTSGGGYFYTKHLEVAGQTITILGLNSAWLAQGGDEDRGRLVIGERQTRAALACAGDAGLKIALFHHPFDWLSSFDREDSGALLADTKAISTGPSMHQAISL